VDIEGSEGKSVCMASVFSGGQHIYSTSLWSSKARMRRECMRCHAARSSAKEKCFCKIQKRTNKKRKARKRRKVKSQKQNLPEILSSENESRKQRRRIFLIHLVPPRSPGEPVTELPGSSGTLDAPIHLPLMHPPYSLHEEIEPLVARRTILKRVRCGLNLEQR
jgi:ATPase subunit of ABC transporter with duplicated ATPase domains